MLYVILASAGFFIQTTDGSPIPGAWVGNSGEWFGFSDSLGYYSYYGTEPESLTVHATGFADWAGLKPLDTETVFLTETAFASEGYILVTASRGSLINTIPSTTQLTEDDILDISIGGMSSLNGKVAGVSVREYGGSMPVVSVSLRGGDPSGVNYMIDGVSIVSARDGMPTGIFDPSVFTSVEIARGGGSAGGIGSGSAGAVNYLPPLSSQTFSMRITSLSNGGTYFSGKYHGSALSLRRNVGSYGSVGYSTTFLTTGRYKNLNTGFIGAWAEGDIEGPDWSPATNGYRKQAQAEGWATLVYESLEFDVSSGAGLVDYLQSEPFSVDDTHKDFTTRFSLLWNGPLTVKGGFNSTWLRSTATSNHSMQFATIHMAKMYNFLKANLDCKLASDNTLHISGRATVEQQFDAFTFHTSLFSDYRAPTVNDLYWPADGYTSGNPELESERSAGAEIGAAWDTEFFTGTICGFLSRSNNLIIWLPDESSIWTPSNISSSSSHGVEIAGGFSHNFSTLTGTFSWNIATDETEGTPRTGMLLPYRPEYCWGVSADLEMPWEMALGVNLTGVAKRFINRTQSEFLDDYILTDASLGRRLFHEINLAIGMSNIFNTAYEETNGFTGRARNYHLTLEYNGE